MVTHINRSRHQSLRPGHTRLPTRLRDHYAQVRRMRTRPDVPNRFRLITVPGGIQNLRLRETLVLTTVMTNLLTSC